MKPETGLLGVKICTIYSCANASEKRGLSLFNQFSGRRLPHPLVRSIRSRIAKVSGPGPGSGSSRWPRGLGSTPFPTGPGSAWPPPSPLRRDALAGPRNTLVFPLWFPKGAAWSNPAGCSCPTLLGEAPKPRAEGQGAPMSPVQSPGKQVDLAKALAAHPPLRFPQHQIQTQSLIIITTQREPGRKNLQRRNKTSHEKKQRGPGRTPKSRWASQLRQHAASQRGPGSSLSTARKPGTRSRSAALQGISLMGKPLLQSPWHTAAPARGKEILPQRRAGRQASAGEGESCLPGLGGHNLPCLALEGSVTRQEQPQPCQPPSSHPRPH